VLLVSVAVAALVGAALWAIPNVSLRSEEDAYLEMRQELDTIRVPANYRFLSEHAQGSYIPFDTQDPIVTRRYEVDPWDGPDDLTRALESAGYELGTVFFGRCFANYRNEGMTIEIRISPRPRGNCPPAETDGVRATLTADLWD